MGQGPSGSRVTPGGHEALEIESRGLRLAVRLVAVLDGVRECLEPARGGLPHEGEEGRLVEDLAPDDLAPEPSVDGFRGRHLGGDGFLRRRMRGVGLHRGDGHVRPVAHDDGDVRRGELRKTRRGDHELRMLDQHEAHIFHRECATHIPLPFVDQLVEPEG